MSGLRFHPYYFLLTSLLVGVEIFIGVHLHDAVIRPYDRLGFTRPSLMRVLIGTYFTWVDILSYTLGIGLVVALESLKRIVCDHLSKKARSSGPSGAGEIRSC